MALGSPAANCAKVCVASKCFKSFTLFIGLSWILVLMTGVFHPLLLSHITQALCFPITVVVKYGSLDNGEPFLQALGFLIAAHIVRNIELPTLLAVSCCSSHA